MIFRDTSGRKMRQKILGKKSLKGRYQRREEGQLGEEESQVTGTRKGAWREHRGTLTSPGDRVPAAQSIPVP